MLPTLTLWYKKEIFLPYCGAHALSFDNQKTQFRALEDWFHTPQGLDVSNYFALELSHLNGLLYGEIILQLGGSGKDSWLQALHFSHKWQATCSPSSSSTFVSSYKQLPIDRNSVDCIIAPMVMEAFDLANSPLDEIDRILKPMGYVVFFGINPLSLWGLHLRFKRSTCFGLLRAKPKSVLSVQRAMMHRGYSQNYFSSFYYIPPVSTKKWLDRLEILNELGKMISPCPAGLYCLVMQKHQEIEPNLLLNEDERIWKQGRILQPSCQLENSSSMERKDVFKFE